LQLASLCGQPLERSPGTEAVFEPGGKLQHAVGRATERTVRQHLRDTVLAIERARTARARRSDPESALEIWQGLIAGRWSLLEQFDRDGRRYLIVHRNDPATPDPRGLTLRECQVLAYALIGHSNKLIGYELGLNESTVAYHVKHACKKLGVTSRVELVQRYSHLVPTPTVAPLQSKS
jgi:DNA-binding CsgD family transcriptional regulator